MNRKIKFRVWDKKRKRFLKITNRIKIFLTGAVCRSQKWSYVTDRNCILQQFVGLKDKNNKEVYEGDIVEFEYSVGDNAWETMDGKEILRQEKMIWQKYTCVVEWVDYLSGFQLIWGNNKSTHMMFPMVYCKNGEIIGNVYENQKLL